MSTDECNDAKKKSARRDKNRRAYEKSKTAHDIVLLRLDPGGLSAFDKASAAAGLSRAAFARLHLLPLVDSLARRGAAIEKVRAEKGQSLADFLSHALDLALAVPPATAVPAAMAASEEFDALFGLD